VASDKWQVASGKWQAASGKWQVANKKRQMTNNALIPPIDNGISHITNKNGLQPMQKKAEATISIKMGFSPLKNK